MSQPPPYPPPQQPPPGYIDLTLQGSVMTSNMITPRVRLNGHQVPATYGPNRFPVPPGRWQVDAYAQWMWQYGQASLLVDVAPGQVVPVYYAAPVLTFMRGSMGHVKQPRKGLIPLLAVLAVLSLAITAAVLFAILGT